MIGDDTQMAGWDKKAGIILSNTVSEDKIWSLFNYVFSNACSKRNTYKFGLIKAISDNLFNCEWTVSGYKLSFNDLFSKFAENYWNLVVKYGLRQMRPDGKSEYSKIEQIFLDIVQKYDVLKELTFSGLTQNDMDWVTRETAKNCKKYVLGALYNDFEGLFYAFDVNHQDYIILNPSVYDFMLRYKPEIEKLNYFAWAKFLETINDESVLIKLLDKLELATPHREDLSIYREILRKEFEENTCFYCGKKLTGVVHVDHFIPWSYVKDDKMWNFVLSCSSCNLKKNNRIPVERFLIKIQNRNSRAKQIQNRIVYEDFKEYNNDRLQRLWKYAQLSGLKEFSL